MADVTPHHFPGDSWTGHCEAAVVGGRAVQISGPRVDGNYQVGPPSTAGADGAGTRIAGVVSRDKAAGDKVMVFGGPGTIIDGEVAAIVAAGDFLEVNAAGQFIPLAAGVAVAQAFDDIANGARGPIRLL